MIPAAILISAAILVPALWPFLAEEPPRVGRWGTLPQHWGNQ